ncbi:MAG: acetyl-CoA carboxylase biotin carboxyl carrier protein subunit [Chloroflexia bacterium]|nr:acetyl-CoA carboxylase biotin carboxyl carrier protein subunit [Chloroflexia bacterium]
MLMKEFEIKVRERIYHVGLDGGPEEGGPMHLDGFALNWKIIEVEGSVFRVCIDGIEYELELRENEEGQTVALVEGEEYPFEVSGLVLGQRAPRKAEKPAAAAPEMVEGALTAMMPSKVIAVHVKEQDEVTAGQVVLVLEAMKMESELAAPQDGVVAAVHCAPGDSVDPGVPLIVIEPKE